MTPYYSSLLFVFFFFLVHFFVFLITPRATSYLSYQRYNLNDI